MTIEPILFNQQWEEAKNDPANAQDIFLLLYWPTYSDAGTDNLWSMFHSSEAPFFNLSYWKNEEFDKLIDDAAALTVTDPDSSFAKYEEGAEPARRRGARLVLLRHEGALSSSRTRWAASSTT